MASRAGFTSVRLLQHKHNTITYITSPKIKNKKKPIEDQRRIRAKIVCLEGNGVNDSKVFSNLVQILLDAAGVASYQ
jgi:hypothetical protein